MNFISTYRYEYAVRYANGTVEYFNDIHEAIQEHIHNDGSHLYHYFGKKNDATFVYWRTC